MSLSNSSNRQYHADKTHLSSSGLKLILKDPEQFHVEHVLGLKTEQSKPAFDEGSYVHSLCLEPEKIAQEYAIYEGLRKSGERFEAFKAENAGKIILSAAQKLRSDNYFQAYSGRPEAVALLQNGLSEHTMTSELLDVPVKARADYINVEEGYIVDVKTTAYPADLDFFKQTIVEYKYELSASLYCQIAQAIYKKPFEFYFVVISKCDLVCDVYKASETTLAQGAALTARALLIYKKCKESGIWLAEQPKKDYSSKQYEIREV